MIITIVFSQKLDEGQKYGLRRILAWFWHECKFRLNFLSNLAKGELKPYIFKYNVHSGAPLGYPAIHIVFKYTYFPQYVKARSILGVKYLAHERILSLFLPVGSFYAVKAVRRVHRIFV